MALTKRKADRNDSNNSNNTTFKKQKRGPSAPSSESATLSRSRRGRASRVTSTKTTTCVGRQPTHLNVQPSQRLDVYVFGSNENAELGLGPQAKPGKVQRPRLNAQLSADAIGVVEVAAGGMHCVALTYDNKILTWGVNDLGALGRDTSWSGGLVDMKNNAEEGSDSEDEEGNLNPRESTPTAIDPSAFPGGTSFAHVAASDNVSLALTTDGLVYGWGTFKASDGTNAFSPGTKLQLRPILVIGLRSVTKIVTGTNHALALTSNGHVLSWGFGEQAQLGRRILSRNPLSGLVPRSLGLRNIVDIGCGADHCFAIGKQGDIYSWGANNYGQTGVSTNIGEDNAAVTHPAIAEGLSPFKNITQITGGNAHSIAATSDGKCLTWGRVDSNALGHDLVTLSTADTIKDFRNRPRILKVAAPIPNLCVDFVAAGSDHCIAISKDRKAFSWGFSESYQTGHGDQEDVVSPTLLDNSAVRGKKLVWAGAGGQYSIIAGRSTDDRMPLLNVTI